MTNLIYAIVVTLNSETYVCVNKFFKTKEECETYVVSVKNQYPSSVKIICQESRIK